MSRFIGGAQFREAYDEVEGVLKVAILVWNSDDLDWEKATSATFGSGASATKYVSVVDEASATVTYVGRALPGTATSAASWQISKFTISGNVERETMADSNANYDNVWDDRASLSYG